jgi:hypothetical protein
MNLARAYRNRLCGSDERHEFEAHRASANPRLSPSLIATRIIIGTTVTIIDTIIDITGGINQPCRPLSKSFLTAM